MKRMAATFLATCMLISSGLARDAQLERGLAKIEVETLTNSSDQTDRRIDAWEKFAAEHFERVAQVLKSSRNDQARNGACFILKGCIRVIPCDKLAVSFADASADPDTRVAGFADEACLELTQIYASKMSGASREAVAKAMNQSLKKGIWVPTTLKVVGILRDPSSVPALVQCLRSCGFESVAGRRCAALLVSFGTKYGRQALVDELKYERLESKHLEEYLQSKAPGPNMSNHRQVNSLKN
jgi:hypothetical protein